MPNHDIVVIGASAGGVEALKQLVMQLPADLAAAVFVVMHFPANGVSILPKILTRYGSLTAIHPEDGQPIQLGQIYVAPPDYHLVLHPTKGADQLAGRIRLTRGPRENGHRPAIDTLFMSAARGYGARVIGVILSGTMDDGVAGLLTIKERGGIALVQDPQEALFDGMPCNAIDKVTVDAVLPVAEIAARLVDLTHETAKEIPMPYSHDLENEAGLVAQEKTAAEQGERSGAASPLTCPDCGGVLWELKDGNLLRFRCHVGHTYSMKSLLAGQSDDLEWALWSAVRTLREKATLSRRMAAHANQQNRTISESQYLQRAKETDEQADLIQQMVLQQQAFKQPQSEIGWGREEA